MRLVVPFETLLLFVSSDDGPAFLDEVVPAIFLIFACLRVLHWNFNVFSMVVCFSYVNSVGILVLMF